MKKTIVGLMAALSLVGQARSQQTEVQAAVSVTVQSIFSVGFVGGNSFSFPSGAILGQEYFQGKTLSVSTNRGTDWQIMVSADPLANQSGDVIPMEFNISGAGVGVYSPSGSVFAPVNSVPVTAYTSASTERTVSGLGFSLGLRIQIPATAKTGSYITNLHVTLVDGV